jgi:hypothetical protein
MGAYRVSVDASWLRRGRGNLADPLPASRKEHSLVSSTSSGAGRVRHVPYGRVLRDELQHSRQRFTAE